MPDCKCLRRGDFEDTSFSPRIEPLIRRLAADPFVIAQLNSSTARVACNSADPMAKYVDELRQASKQDRLWGLLAYCLVNEVGTRLANDSSECEALGSPREEDWCAGVARGKEYFAGRLTLDQLMQPIRWEQGRRV